MPATVTSARRPPWYLAAPAMVSAAGVLAPLLYLVVRAVGDTETSAWDAVFTWRNAALLGNTTALVVGVLAVTTLLALPAAWLTTRTDLPGRRFFAVALVMIFATPAYLLAYTLLAAGGAYGMVYHLTGYAAPVLRGYSGSLIALSLYNLPYMLLSLRAGLLQLDPGLEETAQSLGRSRATIFFSVILPQLSPALLAGQLIVALHVVNDFGVVSLMNYHTFSYALYLRYTGFDLGGAAWIAMMMLAFTAVLIGGEFWLLRGLRLHRTGTGVERRARRVELGPWAGPAVAFLSVILLMGVVLPVGTIAYGLTRVEWSYTMPDVGAALWDSVRASLPAAVIATALALPVAYIARRYPGKRSLMIERLSFLGYATPSLAFALGVLVITLRLAPWAYQTLGVLVYAYALHFMAEAVAPLRSALFRASPRVEEASRALGVGPWGTLWRVTLPLLRPGLVVSLALVFLSAMKELPLTMLLAPLGFDTLATNVWGHTAEADYAGAAPYALLIVAIASVFVGVLVWHEQKT